MIQTVVYFTESTCFGGTERVVLDILADLDWRHWRPVLLHYPGLDVAPLLERARDLDVKLREVAPAQGGLSSIS